MVVTGITVVMEAMEEAIMDMVTLMPMEVMAIKLVICQAMDTIDSEWDLMDDQDIIITEECEDTECMDIMDKKFFFCYKSKIMSIVTPLSMCFESAL